MLQLTKRISRLAKHRRTHPEISIWLVDCAETLKNRPLNQIAYTRKTPHGLFAKDLSLEVFGVSSEVKMRSLYTARDGLMCGP
jgi:hypothetical protein